MPFLEVRLTGPTGATLIAPMLVDSGAEETCVPGDWAARLGLQPNHPEMLVSGVDGKPLAAIAGTMQVSFGPRGSLSFTTPVIWSPDIAFACLGQRDFFERWYVCFDARRKLTRVSEHWG